MERKLLDFLASPIAHWFAFGEIGRFLRVVVQALSETNAALSEHPLRATLGEIRLILERWRKALDEIEQAFTTRRDMGAVLDVMR